MADNRKAKEPGLTRRTLLASTGAIAGSLALGACKYGSQLFLLSDPPEADSQHEKWSGSRVKRYRPLGRTGFQMSDISLGSSGLSDAAVVRRAVERGITYFDTSPDYSHTSSETAIGAGIRGASREQLFIVSKFCTPSGHLANDTPVPEVIEAVNGSLQRLGDRPSRPHPHPLGQLCPSA